MMLRVMVATLIVLQAASWSALAAQSSGDVVIGASAGGTYYCISTRCDTGTTAGIAVSFQATPVVGVEASGRRHFCPDCDRFLMGDGAVLLQYPGRRVRPFVGGGMSYSSDPEFMGSHFGLLGATGVSIGLGDRWATRAEVRGRRVGRGDAMGELLLSLLYAVRTRSF
ncbi:MAG TPA: hypothetical protein VFZ69_06075 [Longimicrobiales bacterium]